MTQSKLEDNTIIEKYTDTSALAIILYKDWVVDAISHGNIQLLFPSIPDYIVALGLRTRKGTSKARFTDGIKVILVSPYIPNLPSKAKIIRALKTSFKLHQYHEFGKGEIFKSSAYIFPAKQKHMGYLLPIKTHLRPNPGAFNTLQSEFKKESYNTTQYITTSESLTYDHIQSFAKQGNLNIVAFIKNEDTDNIIESVVVISNKGILQSGVFRYESTDNDDFTSPDKRYHITKYWLTDQNQIHYKGTNQINYKNQKQIYYKGQFQSGMFQYVPTNPNKKYPLKDHNQIYICRHYEKLVFSDPVKHQETNVKDIKDSPEDINTDVHKRLFLLLHDITKIFPKVEVVYTINYQNAIINDYIDPHHAGVLIFIDTITGHLVSLHTVYSNVKEIIRQKTYVNNRSNMEALIDLYLKSDLQTSDMDYQIRLYKRFQSPEGIAAIFVLHLVDTSYIEQILGIHGFKRDNLKLTVVSKE